MNAKAPQVSHVAETESVPEPPLPCRPRVGLAYPQMPIRRAPSEGGPGRPPGWRASFLSLGFCLPTLATSANDYFYWGLAITSGIMLLVAVAAGSALRNFRWPRLERLVGGEKNLERYERALKRERSILDGLLVTRIIASTVLVLLLLGEPLGEPQGLNFAGFSARLGLALGVLLLLVHGVVRGISRAIPERCLVLLLPVAEGVSHLMSPVVWLMDGLGNVMSRALGLERRDSEQEEAREDILDAVSEGERDGAIDDGAREMIENIMEVRDLAVTQVMTPRTSVFTISIDTPPSQALSLVAKRGHSRVPVVGESIDDVKGILYAKDMLQYFAEGKNELPPVREMMRTALFIPETKRTSELLQELKDAKVHLAVVVDEYGGMAGIITVEDIIEEIVGEIEDEYDRADQPESQSIKLLGEREAEVPANVFIDDLNEALNVDIPEGEDYDTVAGFLFSQMGRVPAAGERCAFDNVEFEIVSADERRIHTVRVTVAEAP